MAAVVSYFLATVAGGLVTPGYSHLSDAISELTSSYAPHRFLLAIGFAVYNLALVVLVIGLWRSGAAARSVRSAYLLLLVAAVAGLLMIGPFPQDMTGASATFAGGVHLMLAALASAAVFAAAVLLGIGWRHDPRWRALARPTFAAAGALAVSAPVGFALVGPGTPYFGLVERVVIGVILGWLCVVAVHALRRDVRPVPAPTRKLVRS